MVSTNLAAITAFTRVLNMPDPLQFQQYLAKFHLTND
jgi:hypothetical protein